MTISFEKPAAISDAAMDRRLAIRARHKLSRAIETLTRTMPFHAEVMSAWTAKADPAVGTCGVFWEHGAIQMRYSPAWLDSLSVPEACGVLVHECLHLLFGHPFLQARSGLIAGGNDGGDASPASIDSRALLVATETTVNEFVKTFPLPGSPLLLEQFPQLAPLQSTLVRYELLRRSAPERLGGGTDDQTGDRRADQPAESTDDHSGWQSIREAGTVARLAVSVAKDKAVHTWGHLLDPAARKAVGAATPAAGSQSGSGVERVRSTSHAWLDWPKILGHLPPPRQRSEPTLSRPPRRRPELAGIVPGRRSIAKPPILLVAVDVSSSMSATILGWIKLEVRVLASQYRIALVEIDVQVKRAILLFDDQDRHPELVDDDAHGRGGTCLDAAFAPEILAWAGGDEEVDAVVYFTDGFAPPTTFVPTVPAVWVLADEHDRVRIPAPWGAVVGTDGTIVRQG